MNKETSTPSGLPMIEPERPFEVPNRLVSHLRLFTDLDIRTYLTVMGKLRPRAIGNIVIDELAAKLSVTVIQVRRSLLRLMAFGIVRIKSLDAQNQTKEIELLPDHVSFPSVLQRDSQPSPAQLATTLGDTGNIELYELISRTVPTDTVGRALEETLAVPQDRIRKSRAALFIHLIRKYAKPTDAATGN